MICASCADRMKVDRLVDLAFSPGWAPRCREYREGCAVSLKYRILGVRIDGRYSAGSCQADAWAARLDEGNAIWRTALTTKELPVVPTRWRCCVVEGNVTLDRLIGQH